MSLKEFFSAADKKLHLKLGTLLVAMMIAVLLIALFAGPGYALMANSVATAYGVERYQGLRGEGVPSKSDMVASALPGVLIGAVVQLWWTWFGLQALLARVA